MLEKDVESRVCRYAQRFGVSTEKFTSPSRRSVPDRLFTFPVIIGLGVIVFIEFKAPGKKPTPKQLLDHAKRRARGSLVYVVDNVESGKSLVDTIRCIFGCPDAVGHAPVSGQSG